MITRQRAYLLCHSCHHVTFLTCCSGAGAFGIVLTSVLQNTVEDLLAIGVASLAGYISVLGLPQKRAAAKEKLEKVAGNFAKVCRFAF